MAAASRGAELVGSGSPLLVEPGQQLRRPAARLVWRVKREAHAVRAVGKQRELDRDAGAFARLANSFECVNGTRASSAVVQMKTGGWPGSTCSAFENCLRSVSFGSFWPKKLSTEPTNAPGSYLSTNEITG